MAELDLRPEVRQERREYTVQEIFRLAEKYRHLAKNLSEVFIQASRQGLIYQIETDPEEEEMKERLGIVAKLSRRLKARRQRREFKKLTLVRAQTQVAVEAAKKVLEPVRAQPIQSKVTPLVTPAPVTPMEVKAEPVKEEPKPRPAAANSLLDAARGFNAQIAEPKSTPKVEELVQSGISPLLLSADELPIYKKYADVGQQLLEARQLPHFKTLVDNARAELSPLGVQLLEELAKKAGF